MSVCSHPCEAASSLYAQGKLTFHDRLNLGSRLWFPPPTLSPTLSLLYIWTLSWPSSLLQAPGEADSSSSASWEAHYYSHHGALVRNKRRNRPGR